MKVILLADVKNVGKKGEVVEVSDGYARNFLFRNRLALAASTKSMEVLEDQKSWQHKFFCQVKRLSIQHEPTKNQKYYIFYQQFALK